ncbi:Uncharacterised protein [Candidatus Gugararchaeum adminiculabundum]|nr:Uncharacterised protein [Candidatus Gugararchaeum adminiculabundum]
MMSATKKNFACAPSNFKYSKIAEGKRNSHKVPKWVGPLVVMPEQITKGGFFSAAIFFPSSSAQWPNLLWLFSSVIFFLFLKIKAGPE